MVITIQRTLLAKAINLRSECCFFQPKHSHLRQICLVGSQKNYLAAVRNWALVDRPFYGLFHYSLHFRENAEVYLVWLQTSMTGLFSAGPFILTTKRKF